MSAPFIPTVHIERWQINGFPVLAAFNVPLQSVYCADSGDLVRAGLPADMMPGETLVLKSQPYPHWDYPWDT